MIQWYDVQYEMERDAEYRRLNSSRMVADHSWSAACAESEEAAAKRQETEKKVKEETEKKHKEEEKVRTKKRKEIDIYQ